MSIVRHVDDLSNELCKLADMAECIRLLHPDATWKSAAEECVGRMGNYVETLNTDFALYSSLKSSLTAHHVDPIDRRIGRMLVDEFEDSGVHLKDEDKRRFVQLSHRVFESGANFVRAVTMPTRIDKEMTVSRELRQFAERSPSNDGHFLHGTLAMSRDANLRRESYECFYGRDAERERFLMDLLQVCHFIPARSICSPATTSPTSPASRRRSIDPYGRCCSTVAIASNRS